MPYLDSLVLHYYTTLAKCIGDTGRQRNMDCLHSVSYISSHSYNRYQVHYFIHSYCSYSQYLIFIISFIQQVSCCFSHEARILLKFGMNHFNFPVPMAWCHTDNEILHAIFSVRHALKTNNYRTAGSNKKSFLAALSSNLYR